MSKISGAAASMFLFILIFLFISDFDLSQTHETVSPPWIWAAFFGYGIISSLFIDALLKKIQLKGTGLHLLFYMLARVSLWLILWVIYALKDPGMFIPTFVIAGIITTACA
jgi:hypothetical protein